MTKDIHVILGPTASGKSAYACGMADKENGVIINFDSMQVYNALPILTAQPSLEEQAQIPHRLYGYIDPAQSCNAASWAKDGAKEIQTVWAEDKMPILVGGTGLYLMALIEGLSPVPDCNPETRKELEKLELDELETKIKELDPAYLKILAPNDRQRMTRALEVILDTGKSLLWWQQQPKTGDLNANYTINVLNPDRDWLADRINARVHKMLDMGALDEIQNLADKIEVGEVPESAGVVMAHGFRVWRDYLKGTVSKEHAIERTQIETRQYAKRQRTFLRNQILDNPALNIVEL